MWFEGKSELPESLVEEAISAYAFNSSASVREEMMIRQWEHSQEYGPFEVGVEEKEEALACTYKSSEEEYVRQIPKTYSQVSTEVYPIGDVEFERLELMAVSLTNGYPWTSEAFVAWYWGTLDEKVIGEDNKWLEDVRVLQQYFPPREITGEAPECTVPVGESVDSSGFHTINIRYASQSRTPNPWAYAALMVLYEDETLASKFIGHEGVFGDSEQYSLTPPDSLR